MKGILSIVIRIVAIVARARNCHEPSPATQQRRSEILSLFPTAFDSVSQREPDRKVHRFASEARRMTGLVYFEVLEVLDPRSVDIPLQNAPVAAGPSTFTIPGSSQFALPLQPLSGVMQNSIKFDGVIRAVLFRDLPLRPQDFCRGRTNAVAGDRSVSSSRKIFRPNKVSGPGSGLELVPSRESCRNSPAVSSKWETEPGQRAACSRNQVSLYQVSGITVSEVRLRSCRCD